MRLFFDSLWTEAEALAQLCKGHYCPKELVKAEIHGVVQEYVCSQKACKLVEQTNWIDVVRVIRPGSLE